MNFILCERDVLGLKASPIRSKISGTRFYHLISGENDFAKVGERWKFWLNGIARKNKVANRRPPFNAEPLEFDRIRLLIGAAKGKRN